MKDHARLYSALFLLLSSFFSSLFLGAIEVHAVTTGNGRWDIKPESGAYGTATVVDAADTSYRQSLLLDRPSANSSRRPSLGYTIANYSSTNNKLCDSDGKAIFSEISWESNMETASLKASANMWICLNASSSCTVKSSSGSRNAIIWDWAETSDVGLGWQQKKITADSAFRLQSSGNDANLVNLTTKTLNGICATYPDARFARDYSSYSAPGNFVLMESNTSSVGNTQKIYVDNVKISFSDGGVATNDFNSIIQVAVTPVQMTDFSCDSNHQLVGGEYEIPATTGVKFYDSDDQGTRQLLNTGVKISATAGQEVKIYMEAEAGYDLDLTTNGITNPQVLQFSSLTCSQDVVLSALPFTEPTCDQTNNQVVLGSFEIPNLGGVDYYKVVDPQTKSLLTVGTHQVSPDETVEILAEAKTGYVLDTTTNNVDNPWTHTFASVDPNCTSTPVTPTPTPTPAPSPTPSPTPDSKPKSEDKKEKDNGICEEARPASGVKRLMASQIGSNSVKLYWATADGPISGYTIYYWREGGDRHSVQIDMATDFQINDLEENQKYTFEVVSMNKCAVGEAVQASLDLRGNRAVAEQLNVDHLAATGSQELAVAGIGMASGLSGLGAVILSLFKRKYV